MSLFSDDPELGHLELNLQRFIDSICDFIINVDSTFTIGILGEWGTGKTTLLKNLANQLEMEHHYSHVEFDAWKFQREAELISIPLMLTIIEKLYRILEWEEIQNKKFEQHYELKNKVKKIARGLSINLKVALPYFLEVGGTADIGKMIDEDHNTRMWKKQNLKIWKKQNLKHQDLEKHKPLQSTVNDGVELIKELFETISEIRNQKIDELIKTQKDLESNDLNILKMKLIEILQKRKIEIDSLLKHFDKTKFEKENLLTFVNSKKIEHLKNEIKEMKIKNNKIEKLIDTNQDKANELFIAIKQLTKNKTQDTKIKLEKNIEKHDALNKKIEEYTEEKEDNANEIKDNVLKIQKLTEFLPDSQIFEKQKQNKKEELTNENKKITNNLDSVGDQKHILKLRDIELSRIKKELDRISDFKLIVFVDDLDRCTPDKTIQVLEAIKINLDIPKIIFVLALSDEIVKSALRVKYSHLENYESDYLKKIIQLPLRMPIWKPQDLIRYMETLLKKQNQKNFKEMFLDNKKLIAQGVELNPRELKRFINTCVLTRRILQNYNIDIKKFLTFEAIQLRWTWFFNEISKNVSILKQEDSLLISNNPSMKEKSDDDIDELDKIRQKIFQDNSLLQFIREHGKVLFEISEDEWDQFRIAGNIVDYNIAIEQDVDEIDEDLLNSYLAEFNKVGFSDYLIKLLENNTVMAEKLGFSISGSSDTFNKNFEKIKKIVKTNEHFASSLATSLGRELKKLKPESQTRIMSLASTSPNFANKLAYSIGPDIKQLGDLQNQIVEFAINHDEFAAGLGASLGKDFVDWDLDLQRKIISISISNDRFAGQLGYSIGENFSDIKKDIIPEIIQLVKTRSTFAGRFGKFTGQSYSVLDEKHRKILLDLIGTENFTETFGYALGREIFTLDENKKREILDAAIAVPKFANFLNSAISKKIDSKTQENMWNLFNQHKNNKLLINQIFFALSDNFSTLENSTKSSIHLWLNENLSVKENLEGCEKLIKFVGEEID